MAYELFVRSNWFRVPFDEPKRHAYSFGDWLWIFDENQALDEGCLVYSELDDCYAYYTKDSDGDWDISASYNWGGGRWNRTSSCLYPDSCRCLNKYYTNPNADTYLAYHLNRVILTGRWKLEVSLYPSVKNVIVDITSPLMPPDISDIIAAYAEPVHPVNRLDMDFSEPLRETS